MTVSLFLLTDHPVTWISDSTMSCSSSNQLPSSMLSTDSLAMASTSSLSIKDTGKYLGHAQFDENGGQL